MATEAEEREANVIRVLVVGGRSRSGQAFRRHIAGDPGFSPVVLTRFPLAPHAGEEIVTVQDYFGVGDKILRSVDAVVNFAGMPQGDDAALLQAVNVDGPTRLARAAKAAGVKHFIHVSSLHIYGETETVGRDTPEFPRSAYARSKQAADVALAAVAAPGFVITLLRVPMHYGPGGAGGKMRVLAKAMLRLGWFPVPPRSVRRSVLHLSNLAAAIVSLLKDPRPGIQFAADPEPFEFEALAEAAYEKSGMHIRLLRLPELAFLPLKLFASPIYRRLYTSNVIDNDAVLRVDYPTRLKDGLKDIIP
jgi:UDP-glucose 4-epimerase